MMRAGLLWLLTLLVPLAAWPQDEETSLWEYGAGFGYVHFEHYPASNQFSNLFLPFPTFQYRGRILRADDREGTRAYLLKSDRWSFELAGGGYPALDSGTNDARRGMEDLPWMAQLGPQLVVKLTHDLEFKIAVFQAVSSDFVNTKTAGAVFDGRLEYRWIRDFAGWRFVVPGQAHGKLTLSLKGGDRQFLSTYFEVPLMQSTSARPSYEAKAGLLGSELAYFQSFRSGRAAFYLGAAIADYTASSNRESPLHKSDRNVTYLVGFTYVLGESERPSVPPEQTEGVINRLERRYQQRLP